MGIKKTLVSTAAGERLLADLEAPLVLDALVPGSGPWEIEIGFGKGRYLLQRAREEPGHRFLGIEIASKYYRRVASRVRRWGLGNVVALRGDGPYLMSAVLPTGFARAVHVYFPDPWPKVRHHKRRLFDPESLDLLLRLLRPDGRLWLATDFLDYGELAEAMLRAMPGLVVERFDDPWPEGPRTNYEAKYMEEGRPILRLGVRFRDAGAREEDRNALHPQGAPGILCAWAERRDPAEE